MALAAGTQWEAWATGSDTACSGGFNPANNNFATDGAATSATGNSPVFSSASYTFVAGDVGAWVFVKSGTNWTPGWYKIASVSGGAATLSAAVGEAVAWPGAILTTNGALQVPNTVAGCATTASPTGATFGVDYSQQAAAAFAFTDMVIDGAVNTRFTSAGFPVGKNFVGNLVKVTSGSGFTVQTVEVVSTSGTVATCDKSLGTVGSTGGNGYLGGALAGPQLAVALSVTSNRIWWKSGAYTMSSATQNVANGKLVGVASVFIEGYGTVRGDLSTPPVITVSGVSTLNMVNLSTTQSTIRNVTCDGNSQASVTAFTGSTNETVEYCKALNSTAGFSSGNTYRCAADTCTTGFNGGRSHHLGVAKSCTTGFANCWFHHCIATGCTTGFSFNGGYMAAGCVAYNSTNGFVVTTGAEQVFVSCVAHTSSSRGFDMNTGAAFLRDCAAYNSTTADVRYNSSGTTCSSNLGFVSLSADPFTNAAGGDFSLNNTAGGGAELRGLQTLWHPLISTTTNADIGAAQHADAGGGGGGKIFESSIIQGHGVL